jgi:hypothetical protein
LLAVLLALGMLCISVQADVVNTDASAQIDDANDFVVVETPVMPIAYAPALVAAFALDHPIPHAPELSIFRPPRRFAV